MKKLMSIVLALCMALSLCVTTTWADGTTNVAQIGEIGYSTLKDAVDAVTNSTATTITLLEDCTGAGIVVPSDRNITFDLAGHTYTIGSPTVGSTGTETNGFQLLKDSTIKFQNGKITSSTAKKLIQNYCNLTLENMILDGSNLLQDTPNYTLSNNCGDVEIKDTTIIAKEGGVAFDVYGGFGSYGDVTVTVTGNSQINGKIEVARGNSNNNKNTLNFESGTHNGEFSVTKDENKEDNTVVSVTGGTFSTDVTAFVPTDTAVAKDENGSHYVGGDNIAAAANSGKDMTMVQGGAIDGLEPGATIIVPEGVTGTVLNGDAVEWGYYTIAEPYHHEPIRRQHTTTTVADTTTPDTKADDTTKIDTVTSAKTFDVGIAMYVGMSLMSVAGTAVVIGKKKEF